MGKGKFRNAKEFDCKLFSDGKLIGDETHQGALDAKNPTIDFNDSQHNG